MGTSKNQCINILFLKLFQISAGNLHCHWIVCPSLFYKRNKQGTGLADYRNLRVNLLQNLGMSSAFNGALCGNDTYTLVSGNLRSYLRTSFDHT